MAERKCLKAERGHQCKTRTGIQDEPVENTVGPKYMVFLWDRRSGTKERDPGTIEMGEDPKLLLTKSLPSLFDANEERKNGVMISSSCGTKKYQAIRAVLHRTLRNDNYKAFFISGLQDPFAYKRQRMAVAGDSSNFIFSQKNGRGREKVLHASESRR